MLTGSNFDLKNYTNYEMKSYKETRIEKIDPEPTVPASESPQLFESWNEIIKKHSRDNLYKQLRKKR